MIFSIFLVRKYDMIYPKLVHGTENSSSNTMEHHGSIIVEFSSNIFPALLLLTYKEGRFKVYIVVI